MQTQTTKPQQMSMMATLQTVRYLVDWRGENSARFNSSVSRPGKLFYGLNLLFFLNACGGANEFLVVKTTDLSSRSFLANAEPPNAEPPNAEPPIVTLAERSLTFAVNRPGEGATHTLFVDLSRYVAVFATAPPVWRVEGTLPPGLSLDTATGILIGSPLSRAATRLWPSPSRPPTGTASLRRFRSRSGRVCEAPVSMPQPSRYRCL